MKKFWNLPPVSFVVECVMLYFSRRVGQAAACLAYFLVLSVFPILICISSVLGLADINTAALIGQLEPVLPDAALDVIRSYLFYVSYHQSPALFLAGLAAGWFSSAAAFRTITRVILDLYENVSLSMVRNILTSVVFPFALLLTVNLSVMVVVTGQRSLREFFSRFPSFHATAHLWSWLRYCLLFLIFFLFLVAILYLAAPPGTPRRPILVSGMVSSLALVVASAIFSWIIALSSRYSLVYGSLMSIIVLLVWLYLCGQILFWGMVCTSVWYQRRRAGLNRPAPADPDGTSS